MDDEEHDEDQTTDSPYNGDAQIHLVKGNEYFWYSQQPWYFESFEDGERSIVSWGSFWREGHCSYEIKGNTGKQIYKEEPFQILKSDEIKSPNFVAVDKHAGVEDEDEVNDEDTIWDDINVIYGIIVEVISVCRFLDKRSRIRKSQL